MQPFHLIFLPQTAFLLTELYFNFRYHSSSFLFLNISHIHMSAANLPMLFPTSHVVSHTGCFFMSKLGLSLFSNTYPLSADDEKPLRKNNFKKFSRNWEFYQIQIHSCQKRQDPIGKRGAADAGRNECRRRVSYPG